MRIDNKLNAVLEVETETMGSVFIHTTPISRDVFKKYFMTISRTFTALIAETVPMAGGPRIAALLLEKIAKDHNEWEGPDGVANGLVAEIRRLTNVMIPSDNGGWRLVAFQDILATDILSEDDISEVEGIITFFTCVSAMMRKNDLTKMILMLSVWGLRGTSHTCMEFIDSLPKSNRENNSTIQTLSVAS